MTESTGKTTRPARILVETSRPSITLFNSNVALRWVSNQVRVSSVKPSKSPTSVQIASRRARDDLLLAADAKKTSHASRNKSSRKLELGKNWRMDGFGSVEEPSDLGATEAIFAEVIREQMRLHSFSQRARARLVE